MEINQRVFIKELDQVGKVLTLTKDGKPETVTVKSPNGGEEIVNVLEKKYKILSGILQVLALIISLFRKKD